MKTEEHVSHSSSRLPQMAMVVISAVAAVWIARSGPAEMAAAPEAPKPKAAQAPYDMLAYLDTKVGLKENQKDVRCWSSCNKLLMFITDAEISEAAKAERIEQHMALIQKLYDACGKRQPGEKKIGVEAVKAELAERFPREDSSQGSQFNVGGAPSLLIKSDVLKDYEDTIEPWRLLQTWATYHVDNRGKLTLEVQFDEPALKELYIFFRSYDLAMLRKARENAVSRKLRAIDAEAIRAAFAAWQSAPSGS